MSAQTPQPGGNDKLLTFGIAVFVASFAFAMLLLGAGHAAAFLTGQEPPTGSAVDAFGVFANRADPGAALGAPGLHPVAYWAVLAVMLAVAVTVAVLLFKLSRSIKNPNETGTGRIVGTATRAEVAHLASGKALVRHAAMLRPSLTSPRASDVGYLIGHCFGKEVWAKVEDSILVIGPPRSGKGLHLVVNAILDAPGPVVTTSTRPDNLAITISARAKRGPVVVFDPQSLAAGIPGGLRWSPVRGCEHATTAMTRAKGLATATGVGGANVEGGNFWEENTYNVLFCLLHAAALDKRPALDLLRWTQSPQAALEAVNILRSHPSASSGWDEILAGVTNGEGKSRDAIWKGVALSMSALADPRVLAAVSPEPGEEFDPETFLRSNGTLYLLATGTGAGAAAALVAAFIEDIIETAKHFAAKSPGARLDPPLLLALDEIANLAPLPSLPNLMAAGGGSGITTMPIFQSVSLARASWGVAKTDAIWAAAITKIILSGISSPEELRDISLLIGERDEEITTETRDARGQISYQKTIRRVPILSPEEIRTLPFGTAVTGRAPIGAALPLPGGVPPAATRLGTIWVAA